MNKQEIIDYIKYKGKYTKEVKTRLNKLIKKYHPDKSKDDKKTILILYDVKKELESGKELDYKKDVKESKTTDKDNSTKIFFIERIIKSLKKRKNFIQKELNSLYKRSYYYTNKIYEESYDKGLLDIKIEELENNIELIKKIGVLEIILLSIVLIIIFIAIITKSVYIFLLILIPILFEILYLNIKNNYIIETTKLINRLKQKRQEFIDREENYNKNIKEIRKHEIKLEKEIRSINNDISYYNHELSKENTKTKEYQNKDTKVKTK